jgi:hypothetical protein
MIKEKNFCPAKPGRNSNLFWVVILSIFFSLGGGAAAMMIARPYFIASINVSPVVNQANNSSDNLRQANSIIENAKKIIAGQENKINDTISAGQNSLVGIFKKNPAAATSSAALAGKNLDISVYYKLSDAVGEGIVVTSDGWVFASGFAKNMPESSLLKNFVVITRNKDIYSIDKISQTGVDSYLFLHLDRAKDLPVKSFISKTDLAESQSLVALDWQGKSYLTSLVNKVSAAQAVKDSDVGSQDIVFSDNLGQFFDNAFIFSLGGQVVGYFDKKNGSIPLYNFQPLINGLLEEKQSKHASLGISYVNLQEYAIKDVNYNKGILIYSDGKSPAIKPGGAAALAGLQAGDIINSVDNTAIDADHDLRDILEKYSAGDQINLIFRRNGAENSVSIKLQELK